MELFGTYETIKELAWHEGVKVFSARKRGTEGEAVYAIKLCCARPEEGAAVPESGDQTAFLRRRMVYGDEARFVAAAERQRAASSGGSAHVGLVFMLVKDDVRGPWYATMLYPLTLKKILDSRIELSAELVHRLLMGVVRGLREFSEATRLSHGNLKPSNVLIGGHGKELGSEVVLEDPAPGLEETAAYDLWLADLRALGEMIHAIVRKHEGHAAANWPLAPSPEWTAQFGRRADDWREFCNRLLAPDLSARDYGIDALEEDLAGLKSKPPVWAAAVGVLVGLALLGAGYVGYRAVQASRADRVLLTITSEPPGAEVFIGDASYGKAPQVRKRVPRGDQRIVLRAEYHDDWVTNVVLESRTTNFHAVLTRSSNTVELTSWPPGARVYAGQHLLGQTPTPVRLAAGPQELRFEYAAGGRTQTLSRNVTVEKFRSIRIEPSVDFPLGYLSVTSSVPGAKVLVDGQEQGETSFSPRLWPTGQVSLQVEHPLYDPWTSNVVIGFKTTNMVPVQLVRSRGRVALRSWPEGAEVYAGSQFLGTTPTNVMLLTGTQQLEFRYTYSGDTSLSDPRTVNVERGTNQPVDVIFQLGYLSVTSGPSNATVWVDNREVGTIPWHQFWPAGQVSLRVEHPLYESRSDDVVVGFKTTNAVPVQLVRSRGRVALRSWPEGAEVYLGTNRLGATPREEWLETGPQELVFRYTYWGTNSLFEKKQVEITRERNDPVEIRFSLGYLDVTSVPPEAKVFVGDREIGKTPRRQLWPTGSVDLRVELGGYDSTATNATVHLGEDTRVPFVLERAKFELLVTSSPVEAEMFLGETPLGTAAPNRPITVRLPSGPHGVQFRTRRYTRDVMLEVPEAVPWPGVARTNVELPIALLSVTSDPRGAEILINHELRGLGPMTDEEVLVEGETILVVRKDGYDDWTLKTNLVRASRATVHAILSPRAGPPKVDPDTPKGVVSVEPPSRALTNGIGMVLVWVETNGCYVGKYEVTLEEYEEVMGTHQNPWPDPRHPVTRVSASEAKRFCEELTGREATTLAGSGLEGWGYRLPELAEWQRYGGGDQRWEHAVDAARPAEPATVGSRKPNAFSLYDVRGNVWEWSATGASGRSRILGGSYVDPLEVIWHTDAGGDTIGFRVLLAPPQSP